MAEYIVNPRRAPRATARCHAAVVARTGAFDAETEDIGARGCQVVSPQHVKRGEAIDLVITSEKVPEPLKAAGKIAWVSPQPPWRVGVAFHEAFVPSAERWFEKLAAATPGIGSFRKVPERIALDSMVYLGPPPKFLLDFSPEEASLLRAIASGARLDELQARLRDRWPAAQRALFSLLARSAVTLSRGQSAHPDTWKRILTEIEASLAVESLGTPPPAPAMTFRERPAPTPNPAASAPTPLPVRAAPTPTPTSSAPTPVPVRSAPTPIPARPVPARSTPTPARPIPAVAAAPLPPRRLATPVPASFTTNPAASPWGTPVPSAAPVQELEPSPDAPIPRGAARANPGAGWTTPPQRRPVPGTAGVGWRDAAVERGPEAQERYQMALAEIELGNVNGALALLREALSYAPGDAEIAAALGRLAFKDRLPGAQ
jgi:hypothetical protein